MDWQKQRKFYKPLIYTLWSLLLIGVLSIIVIFIVIAQSDLPTFEDLENPKYDLASIIFDINGETIGKYYIENREQISFEELSPNVLNALLSTEDERYFNHVGIDARALLRVVVKTLLLNNEGSGGGSTITQQLAKLLYKRPALKKQSSFNRAKRLASIKFKEWITAVKLEKSYTKEEIIAMYLNKFEFVNGAHGVQAAAQIYFGKDQKDLNISEAALLVGMLQNPARYNPNRFPERAKSRRNIVLRKLRNNRYISKVELDSMNAAEIDLSKFRLSNQSEGPAPYFRAELTKWLKDLFNEPQYAKLDGSKYNIYTDGLKIHTTLDLKYQKHAESVVKEHMAFNQAQYWKVWRGMNPFIFEAEDFQVDLRKESVERRIHYSDRYIGLFNRVFSNIKVRVKESYSDFELTEPALRILFQSNEERNNLQVLTNPILRNNYSKLMDSEIWEDIKTSWATFRSAYVTEFDTPLKMQVFDYGKEGTIEKEMTPRDSVIYHLRHLQAGMLAVEPNTGHIKAWVGGVDHNYFKFDHINNRRQVGSTIKPFVYATAIGLQGISPCQEFDDIQYTIAPGDADFQVDKEWSPSNANGIFTGNKYNLYQGLLYSKNSITVRLVKEMGNVEVIRELLDNVGISKTTMINDRLLVPRIPSICLGSVDLSVMEMTGAYTTFANNGVYTKPVFVDYIEDRYGRMIYRAIPQQKKALNPMYSAVMVNMLRNNTGGRLGMGIKSENGGKTGTTNDYADAWFMGITPELVVGTWVGGDEKWVRFFTLDVGQGYVLARPIFQMFMNKIESDPEIAIDTLKNFPEPPEEFYEFVDCTRYKRGEPEDERAESLRKKALNDEFEEEFEVIDTIKIKNN